MVSPKAKVFHSIKNSYNILETFTLTKGKTVV